MSYKGFVFKLKPQKAQHEKLKQFAGSKRFVYNYFLDLAMKTYQQEQRQMGYNEMAGLLTQLKRTEEYAWLNDMPSQALQQGLMDLQSAFKNFFDKLKKGEIPTNPDGSWQKRKDGRVKCSPRFKRKTNFEDTFRIPQHVEVKDNRVKLPKLGWVLFYKSREVEGTVQSATISQYPSGFYISILCELPDGTRPDTVDPTQENSVGIDVGVSSLLVESNGHKVPSLNAYRKLEKKLKREQYRLSKKQKGSRNYFKQQYKIARLHERIANMRQDYAHQQSTRLIRENQAVFAEDLNIVGMMKNHNLAKSIADASMGFVLETLEWKAKRDGKTFHKIDRWYPSSKTCSCCGYKLDDLQLSVREWTCPECNLEHDRDVNAAINILLEGLRQVGAGHSQTSKTLVEDDRLLSPVKQESPDFSR